MSTPDSRNLGQDVARALSAFPGDEELTEDQVAAEFAATAEVIRSLDPEGEFDEDRFYEGARETWTDLHPRSN